MPLLSVNNGCLAYGDVPLLDHVEFQIDAGERVALIGRNGTGKSSLLAAVRVLPNPVPPHRRGPGAGVAVEHDDQGLPHSQQQAHADVHRLASQKVRGRLKWLVL